MLVRHAEKEPDSGPPPYGVNAQGEQDKHSLSPRGWQRAGALVPFFVQAWVGEIETPDAVYASRIGTDALMVNGQDVSKSLRPQQTVMPLVEAIAPRAGLQTPYSVGEERQLAQKVFNESGVVLVAWEHNHIPDIAAAFTTDAPSQWPSGARFDLVWILTKGADGSYAFDEVPQSLLAGDASI